MNAILPPHSFTTKAFKEQKGNIRLMLGGRSSLKVPFSSKNQISIEYQLLGT